MSEINANADITTPIIHKPIYQGERELLGYNPQFEPNTITFDKFNRPYIRTSYGTNPVFLGNMTTNKSVIQTLRNGKWVKLNFLASLPGYNDDTNVITSPFQEERVVFDRDDNIYTIAHVVKPFRYCLFYSNNYGVTWKSYQLPPASHYTFEYTGIDGIYEDTPLIFAGPRGDKLPFIVHLTKNKGELSMDFIEYGATDYLGAIPHSGIPNPGVRVKNKVHVVWASNKAVSGGGTKQYVSTIDLNTKEMLPPVYLGIGKTPWSADPDNHNIPSIVYDGETFHVVLGCHGHEFKYLHSPDARSWSKPEIISTPHTYVGLVIDTDKTLHLAARYGGGYVPTLVYMRKKRNKPWEAHKEMVRPFKTSYSVFYHKIGVDRKGRIFISYMYYGNNLNYSERDEYNARWPNFPQLDRTPGWLGNVKPHDPVILLSDDKGDSFRIALTRDFTGEEVPSIRTPDINKDGIVNTSDLSHVLANWGKCDSDCEADIDGDGYVGVTDLSSVIVNWNKEYKTKE